MFKIINSSDFKGFKIRRGDGYCYGYGDGWLFGNCFGDSNIISATVEVLIKRYKSHV